MPWSPAPISSSRLGAHAVHALANLRGLRVELDEDAAVVAVEADSLGGETDVVANLADDGFVVNLSLGGDLAEHHHHAGLGGGLARDLRDGDEERKGGGSERSATRNGGGGGGGGGGGDRSRLGV